jgi:hypothetical protein
MALDRTALTGWCGGVHSDLVGVFTPFLVGGETISAGKEPTTVMASGLFQLEGASARRRPEPARDMMQTFVRLAQVGTLAAPLASRPPLGT